MSRGLFIPDITHSYQIVYSYSHPAPQESTKQPEPKDELLEQLMAEYPWAFKEDYHDNLSL